VNTMETYEEIGARGDFASAVEWLHAELTAQAGIERSTQPEHAVVASGDIRPACSRARDVAHHPTGPTGKETAQDGGHVFRREGDYWTITYAGTTVRLRDTRGLYYLAQLLHAPGRELHATDLVAVSGGLGNGTRLAGELRLAPGLGDPGSPLDARARAAYRQRLAELREELQDAEELNDLGRLERARVEIAALRTELAAAKRRHGTVSHAERARLTVTKGIKAALARIARSHCTLAAHLAATVRRGYFCRYVPDPRHPITWMT